MSPPDLVALRRRYAKAVTASVPNVDPRIRDAFASVPREDFLGPPPLGTLSGAGLRVRGAEEER